MDKVIVIGLGFLCLCMVAIAVAGLIAAITAVSILGIIIMSAVTIAATVFAVVATYFTARDLWE